MNWFLAYFAIGWIIRVTMVAVVLRRELAPGASIAWLGVIFLHPYIGLSLYILFGEARLGRRRVAKHLELISRFRPGVGNSVPDKQRPQIPAGYEPMVLQAQHVSQMPVLGGNSVEFMVDPDAMVTRLTADIGAAKTQVHLLYYMFAHDRMGDRVVDSLRAAAARGVTCRVLVDAVASRRFFRWHGLARQLSCAGVEVAAALPANLIARRLPRMDLRNHRKLAIIDGAVAYAGSHNLVEPFYGGSPVGPWVDVTGRFSGPIVDELSLVFAEDWAFETGKDAHPAGAVSAAVLTHGTPMQAVPTGPSDPATTYRRVLLAAVQSARRRLILTTPYFVPDEPTLVALIMAADRGVQVNLVLPKHPDHMFTAAAGRAHFTRLLDAGVSIFLYRPGLLHAKTTTVDDAFGVFGSANLDVRSFNLNFELSLVLYGAEVTGRLRNIQEQFLADSDRLESPAWAARPGVRRYADRAISLLSPLL